MANLSTSYLGLTLKSPIIVGSSGLNTRIESIKKYEDAGVGAVVLKSIFEEQILIETDRDTNAVDFHPEGADYFDVYVKEHHLSQYTDFIVKAKKETDLPIIASINCYSETNWMDFARRLEQVGADALEVNYHLFPSDPKMTAVEPEQKLFSILKRLKARLSIPIAVKISPFFSNLSNVLKGLEYLDVDGIVMFNRFYMPDIDINKMKMRSGLPFSAENDYALSMRWIAIASGLIKTDLAASTGVHSGETVIKQLLAGANAVQMVSAVYQKHATAVYDANEILSTWMDERNYQSIDAFRGKMAQSEIENPAYYERVQFLKHYGQV